MCHRNVTFFLCVGWQSECVVSVNWLLLLFFFFLVCSQVSCPYSDINLNKEGLLPDRLGTERPLTLPGLHPRGRRPDQNTNTTTQTSSTPDADHTQNRYAAEGKAESPLRHPEYASKVSNSPKRTPVSVLHATLSSVSAPENGLSVLLGNQE